MSYNEKLIVIGNGFDLNCGLNTTFWNYFGKYGNKEINYVESCNIEYWDKIENEIKNMFKDFNKCINNLDNLHSYYPNRKLLYLAIPICVQYNIKNIPNDRSGQSFTELSNQFSGIETIPNFEKYNDLLKKLNLFDLVLIMGKNYEYTVSNWSDVENILKDILTNENELLSLKIMNTLIDNTKETFNNTFSLDIASIKNFYGTKNDQQLIFYLSLLSIMIKYWGFDIEKDDFSEFLISSLNNFERKFGDYIFEESYCHSLNNYKNSSGNLNYIVRSKVLLKKLFDKDSVSNTTNENIFDNYTLLNFNYTKPSSFDLYGKKGNVYISPSSTRNIHGLAIPNKSNLIIGVDLNSIKKSMFYDEAYKFTKTYRIMRESENVNTLSNRRLILNKKIKNVTFYGHSLSKADYSYFQSIFDYFDIYNNSISLSFCYSVYDKSKRDYIKKKSYDAVFQLINDYGEGFTNKGKGENLLHKLLLENRLSLSEI